MKCITCKDGETHPGRATVTLERGGVTLVIKGVPANVCEVSGEKYLSEETAATLRRELETAQRQGEEVQVRSFAA